MIPTCHRASFDSIVADEDYKSALEYADEERKALYIEQAREIDRIQRDILALAQKEETYDVFICYKETGENGKRTKDSVLANELYYQYTQEGFKVFYAAITLEGKLGKDYEPIIFAALNSAKVMLVVGSKPEYFNAVWVKNEWSRFLKIMKKDRKKLLIPCYRDMDAYELPEEFAHLQAQDMSKFGSGINILNGIKRVLENYKKQPEVIVKEKETVLKETVVNQPVINETTAIKQDGSIATSANDTSSKAILKRAFLSLEDGEWTKANSFCEKVLNKEPENAEAYLVKLMIEHRAKRRSDLKNSPNAFANNLNYKKILRFGDENLKKEITGYLNDILDNRAKNKKLFNNSITNVTQENTVGGKQSKKIIVNFITNNSVYKFFRILGTIAGPAILIFFVYKFIESGYLKDLNDGLLLFNAISSALPIYWLSLLTMVSNIGKSVSLNNVINKEKIPFASVMNFLHIKKGEYYTDLDGNFGAAWQTIHFKHSKKGKLLCVAIYLVQLFKILVINILGLRCVNYLKKISVTLREMIAQGKDMEVLDNMPEIMKEIFLNSNNILFFYSLIIIFIAKIIIKKQWKKRCKFVINEFKKSDLTN